MVTNGVCWYRTYPGDDIAEVVLTLFTLIYKDQEIN